MSRISNDFTFTWIIKNYSFFDIENSACLFSPLFTAENIAEAEWKINIFVDEFCLEKFVCLQLHRIFTRKLKWVKLDIEMELCNSINEILCSTKRITAISFREGKVVTFKKTILLSNLNNFIKKTSSDTLIMKCRMFETAESGNSTSKRCTVQTTICLDEFFYTREVEYSESPQWSRTLSFPINFGEQLDVRIEVQQNDLLIYISQSGNVVIRKIKCEITLLDHEGTENSSNSGFFTFSEKLRKWCFPSLPINSLLRKNPTFFRLNFYFAFSNGLEKSNTSKAYDDEMENSKLPSSSEGYLKEYLTDSLKEDLRKMLFSKQHSDVSFRIDGEIISAHKFILASRSPVFSAMFDHHQMEENEAGVVNISDMDVQTLKLFLEFMYTGKLEDSSWERRMELLLAAEKYQVHSLKKECSRFLKHHLSTDSVCDVVSVADVVEEHTLKDAAIEYIKENFAEVFSSSKWSVFIKSNVELSAEIFDNFSSKLKEKFIEG